MIKIIFIIDILGSGGAERVMSILANRFTEIGYDITIFSKAHGPSFFKLEEKVKVVYPKVKIKYNNYSTNIINRLRLYLNIYAFLKKEEPDLVIPFSTTTNGTVIPICKLLGLHVIASEHTNYKVGLNSFPTWFIKRHIYPHADLITVLTERDKKEFYVKFMKNVTVMPNPLSLLPISYPDNLKRGKIILAIGNVSRVFIKGFDNMLQIFTHISLRYSDWKLWIAGGGDPSNINDLIQKYNLTERVSLLGEVKDIQKYMRQSSIFAMTSRWEGLPMVLIEAMSQGMACISFDCFTGPRDIITDGFDGILVEDQNKTQFENQLSELMENHDLRLTLSRNAVETSKKYLPEIIINKWISLIEKSNCDEQVF